MAMLNIRHIIGADGVAFKAQALTADGQVILEATRQGRKTAQEEGLPVKTVLTYRVLNKLVKGGVPEEQINAAIQSGDIEYSEQVDRSKVSANKPVINLAALMAGQASIPQPVKTPKAKVSEPVKVEGHISAANLGTGKDCGLITVESDREAYNRIASQSIDTATVLTADLEENGLALISPKLGEGSNGGKLMANSMAESGTFGEKAMGPFRIDGNGQKEVSKSDVADPTALPVEHKSSAYAESINRRKGVAGLQTTEKDCHTAAGDWVAQRNAKGKKAKKPSDLDGLDPRTRVYQGWFKANQAAIFGQELADQLQAASLAYRATFKSLKDTLPAGQSLQWNEYAADVGGKIAGGIGLLVACAELGLGFGDDETKLGKALKGWITSTTARAASKGLTIVVQNGQVLLNDQPVTCHKSGIAAAFKLQAMAMAATG